MSDINPELSYNISEQHVKQLSTAFKPLSDEEKTQDWAKEFTIATRFAQEYDLYRALFTYKRAEFLLPDSENFRKQQIQYNILLCYYFGKKYEDVAKSFEMSDLPRVDRSFPAFEDLLIILYESYSKLNDNEKTQRILELINQSYPQTEEKLVLSQAIIDADLPAIQTVNEKYPSSYTKDLVSNYESEKKSVGKAQFLNALCPGAGYLYIGQKKSALTAFLLNGLFIGAAYQFFHKGNVAAGAITTSFEMGWYFGGIYGAGEETKFYNERLYEDKAKPIMQNEKLYPLFMIKYGF